MGTYKLNICHLYPDLMNTYGDKGNVTALLRRCQWRDIECQVIPVTMGDAFDPDLYDMVCLGGGQEREQIMVCQDMLGEKFQGIKAAAADGQIFLCISAGMQIMGEYFVNSQGVKQQGLELIDMRTEAGPDKLMGDVVADCIHIGGQEPQDTYIAGFESHTARTFLGQGVEPLARVLVGSGNNGQDGTEGAVMGNLFCSYLHGSLLPKNYRLTDLLISRALERKYGADEARRIMEILPDSAAEEMARKGCISRLLH